MYNVDLVDKNYVFIIFLYKLKFVNVESVNKVIKMNILKVFKLMNLCILRFFFISFRLKFEFKRMYGFKLFVGMY